MEQEQFEIEINNLLITAEELIPKELLHDLPPMKDCLDAPEWYDFEYSLWDIGEKIRQLMVVNKHCKPSQNQIERIVDIAINPIAKRGRQSFILLLGYKKYQKYANKIASQIKDEHVDGHVISTLYKMQAPNFIDEIAPYEFYKKRTWVRNEAKRYLAKYRL